MSSQRFPCPCCGHLVFGESPGSYEICPICFWEDDAVQLRWPDRGGGANSPCLVEAQSNFRQFGAMEERFVRHVRKADTDEAIDPEWRPIDPDREAYSEWGGEPVSPWPVDPTTLYYWRARFWQANPSTPLATNDPPQAVADRDRIPFARARSIAEAFVSSMRSGSQSFVLLQDETIEKEYGWVFVYTSEEYLATGELRFALGGNAPFIVRKRDGLIDVLGTAHPVEHYLELYERGEWSSTGIGVSR